MNGRKEFFKIDDLRFRLSDVKTYCSGSTFQKGFELYTILIAFNNAPDKKFLYLEKDIRDSILKELDYYLSV